MTGARRDNQQAAENALTLWEGSSMETTLSEQIQATIDALGLAETQAALISHRMRKQRISFGLEYSHMDDPISQITSKLRYLKRLAERREQAEAAERDKPSG